VALKAGIVRSFCLSWIVRPIAFALPVALAAWLCDIPPGWNMAALILFCVVWAECVGLFGTRTAVNATPTPAGSRGRTARRSFRWDFEDVEAIMLGSYGLIGRTIMFGLPVLVVAHWCGTQMGWKLAAWIVFCVVWDNATDRIGARQAPP
jgi:hypothetical protein